jgi:hypothetical protein
MLTLFAVVLLLILAGILVGAAVVETQKKHHARTHGTLWQGRRAGSG